MDGSHLYFELDEEPERRATVNALGLEEQWWNSTHGNRRMESYHPPTSQDCSRFDLEIFASKLYDDDSQQYISQVQYASEGNIYSRQGHTCHETQPYGGFAFRASSWFATSGRK